jgi:WD40 repeat protein
LIRRISLLAGLILVCVACTPGTVTEIGADATEQSAIPAHSSTSTVFSPAAAPIPTATQTPRPANEPGLVATFGEPDLGNQGVPVFSPDGKVIAYAASRIRFWDVATHQLIREIQNPYPHRCVVSEAVFSPDGRFFAVSIPFCWSSDPDVKDGSSGHVLVWDLSSGNLIQEWAKQDATMPPSSPRSGYYALPADGVAFVPKSTKIAFGNRNSIEIRDIFQETGPVAIDLGRKMFASEISFSPDGRFVYVSMDWSKDRDFPAYWTDQYKVQIWDMATHRMRREIRYPEGWASMHLELRGPLLLQQSYPEGTIQALDLQTGAVRDLPFRSGWRYVNADMSFIIFARLLAYADEDQVIELWNTDNWREVYSFLPDFGPDWIYSMNYMVFSPDSRLLAIDHQGQVSLWNIAPYTKP